MLQNGRAPGNRLTIQGDRKYRYDARGNLIEERRGKGGKLITRYHYNLANQLIKVEKDGRTTEYRYDPLGRRIAKTTGDQTTRFLWAGDQMVQESTEGATKTYLYEPESFRPLALVQNDEVYHYHLDHLGTPRELTRENGEVAWQARYRTYGSVALKTVNDIENPIRFQGQYFDEESGLHYNRHRYYNPQTGQFTTQDPIGLLGGINSYQYAPNPTQWVDPLGLSCKEIPENYDPLTDTYKGVDLNLFSPHENIHGYARKVKNNADIFVVGGHGSSTLMQDSARKEVTPSELTKMIKGHPKYSQGMPVYLLSCITGKGEDSYAQKVSNEIGASVVAPDQILWYYPDGSVKPYARKADNPNLPDTSKPGNIRKFVPDSE